MVESKYDKIQSIIMLLISIALLIIGFINIIPELPNNISNTTILLFVLALLCYIMGRDK